MADLQCPATAILLDAAAAPPPWLARLQVAGRFEARGSDAVVALVEETADLCRGEVFVVAAPPADIDQALRTQGIAGTAPIVIDIDSDGWRAVPAP
ncbi:hypothetical protein [Arthrobacter sedimenti]|uniref:hypothetical protein n=1 Tax=Arthrobacter sedimenti TaxID=2694931 RepID=UPI000B35FC87|nr:hypothetical protein [Arthrobacter sedimenti]OUM39486.1 hypothetical protein B8W73_13455 [Arthrobacter agilis]